MANFLRVAIALLVFVFGVGAQTPVTVQSAFGPVTGLNNGQSIEFRGIPYGESPVGALKYEVPVAVSPWTANLDASQNGPGCQQRCTVPEPGCPTTLSEDCLNVNIYTPAAQGSNLPVMVFFHGGNFVDGAGGARLYDPTFYANQTNSVVVGVNYRLGAYGWIYLEQAGILGNMGLYDQILSLRFVQQTISAFGGNPNDVTVFGQSAGGTSIGALLTSPQAEGLFHKALLQSNPFGLGIHNPESAQDVGERFSRFAGCDPDSPEIRQCLDNLGDEAILDAMDEVFEQIDISDFLQNFYPWTPVVDEVTVFEQPLIAWREGNVPDMPLMAGHVSEEGHLYAYEILFEAIGVDDYIILATVLFLGLPVLDIYPPDCPIIDGTVDCRPLIAAAITDYIWVCPTRYSANGVVNTDRTSPVYQYRFDHAFSFDGWGDRYDYCRGQVCHGGELPFSWNDCFVPQRFPDYQCTPEETIMSAQMAGSFGQFAGTGNPNNFGNLPFWPAYTNASDNYMTFATPQSYPVSDLRTEQCDQWDEAGYHPETKGKLAKKLKRLSKYVTKENLMEEVKRQAKILKEEGLL